MLRALLPCLAAGLLCGCFVFDELEAGEQMMEQNSPRAAQAPAAAGGAMAAQGEAGPPTGQAWWDGARSLNTAPEAASDDPNAPIRCRIRGSTRFMRRADCLTQGGREG